MFDVSHIHASFPAAITISYISTINLVDFSCVLFSYNIIKFEKETVFVVEATLRQQANYLPVIFAKSAMPLTATYTKCTDVNKATCLELKLDFQYCLKNYYSVNC